MRWIALAALLCLSAWVRAQEGATAAQPTVSVSAKLALVGDVLAKLRDQAHVLIAAHPFTSQRRITVEISNQPLPAALDAVAAAAVASWDSAYVLLPAGGPYGPEGEPTGWVRPPQTTVSLSGGSGTVDQITVALTDLGAASVGYAVGIEDRIVTTQPAKDTSLETVLSQIRGDHLTWARGFYLDPIDRAAVFGRYANLPPAERAERVLRHTGQMLRLTKADVRQALEARQRDLAAVEPEKRAAEIERYAAEVRAGVKVLNTLDGAVRDQARKAMQIFLEVGLEVYRDLGEDEQIETTPIIEAMGELRR